ncbi:hypothetical protein ACIXR2_23485, partial [Bacteroides fragilis]
KDSVFIMQKLKVKHLFFALGHGERADFMQGFCVEYDPKVWRLRAKPAGSALLLVRFPRRFAKK